MSNIYDLFLSRSVAEPQRQLMRWVIAVVVGQLEAT
jgi:hypothetical protein